MTAKRPNKLAKLGVVRAVATIALNAGSYRKAVIQLKGEDGALFETLEIHFQANAIDDRGLPGYVEQAPDPRFDVGVAHGPFYGGTVEGYAFKVDRPSELIRAAKVLEKIAWARQEYNIHGTCELGNTLDALYKLGVVTSWEFWRNGEQVFRRDLPNGEGAKASAALIEAQRKARESVEHSEQAAVDAEDASDLPNDVPTGLEG